MKILSISHFKNTKKSFINNFFFFVIIASLSAFILSGCSSSTNPPVDIVQMRNKFAEEKYIIHACGMISDEEGNAFDYTNSKEALENSYNLGNRIIEIDFHYTSDHELVCGHAWGDLYMDGKQLTPGEAPTYDDFLKCKVQDEFSVLTFRDVAKFMQVHEDLIVVTDTKETDIPTYKMIAEKYPDLTDRFVIQIYHASEYDDVAKAGFPYIIYTLYETEEGERTGAALLKAAKKQLIGFTFHIDLTEDSDFMNSMKKTGTPLFEIGRAHV